MHKWVNRWSVLFVAMSGFVSLAHVPVHADDSYLGETLYVAGTAAENALAKQDAKPWRYVDVTELLERNLFEVTLRDGTGDAAECVVRIEVRSAPGTVLQPELSGVVESCRAVF